jgi:pimeloyl-ACP methyl ester carboxylesterase
VRRGLLVLALLVPLLSLTSWHTPSHAETRACHVDGIRSEIRCGEFSVPLDHDAPGAEQISLRYVIIPSLKQDAHADPLFFLAGGPGQSAVELAAMIRGGFYEVAQERDLVLVDQRGTGGSKPLQCDAEGLDPLVAAGAALDKKMVHDCLATLPKDLSHFNTVNTVRDLELVRESLGYDKINIYGGSYGTRLGLVYMRMHPQSIRSAVLDSVGPPQTPIGLFGRSAAQSFELLLLACEADTTCSAAFPRLRSTFVELVGLLRDTPQTARMLHPTKGSDFELQVDDNLLINHLRLMLYSPRSHRMIPLLIDQAAKGNFAPLLGVMAQAIDDNQKIYVGLTMNIVCNEDFPRITDTDFSQDADNSFGLDASHKSWRVACPLWPRYTVDTQFGLPVHSDIPVLLVSGEMDPVTPPENAALAAETLTNSRHLVVARGSHTAAFHSCVQELVVDFIDRLDPESLDAECVNDLPPIRFMLSVNEAG